MSSKESSRGDRAMGWVAGALAVGLALRLWFLLHYAHLSGDTMVYGEFARNLLEHHVYGFSGGAHGLDVRPSLIRLPGYPLFLAACFLVFGIEHYTAVMLVQIALDLTTCVLVGGIAGRIFGHRARLAAVWLAAICPFTANYAAAPLTETLTLFSIAAAYYALVRWQARVQGGCAGVNRWLFVIALALAYAILLRPEQGMLAAAIVPAMGWILMRAVGWRKGLKAVVLVSALTLLPLVPWTARNWKTFHVLQPLAPRFANDPGEKNWYGFQRWYRTWAVDFASTVNVYWNYDNAPIQIADLPNRAFDSNQQYAETESVLAEYDANNTPTAALDARFDNLARARIQADPFRYYVELPAARVLNMVLRPRTEMLPVPVEWWKPGGAALFQLSFAVLNLIYFGLAAAGLRQRERWSGQKIVVWSMVSTIGMRLALLLTLDNSEPRYTLEFFPVLIVLGAGWISSFSSLALSKSASQTSQP